MISTIIILLTLTTIFLAICFKNETTMSLPRSIILGLIMSPFFLIRTLVSIIEFIADLGVKLGFALGGTNLDELLLSSLTRKIKDGKIEVVGDRSPKVDEDDQTKH